MNILYFLMRTLAVITIAMLIIYLYGMLIRRFRERLQPWENLIAGFFFSLAAAFSILATRTVFEGSLADGKMALLAVGTLFYGPQSALVISCGILLVWTLMAEPISLNLICNLVTVTGIGLLYRKWLSRRGYRHFYGPMVLLGFLLVAQGLFWNQILSGPMLEQETTLIEAMLLFMLAPAVTIGTGGIFLMEMERRDKELELIRAKEDLTVQNEEITALYEEMAAAEETLQNQFDQLQKNREELMRINDRYKLIYQAGNEGLWEYDYQTKETTLSDRVTEIYGYGPEQKAFMNRERDALIHPEDLPRVYENWRALNRGNIESYDMEYRILHASGEYRWIRAKGIILRDEDGKNLMMAGSHGDIHERKMQEQRLYESAYYDHLTGLPNLDWFLETLETCLGETIATHDVGTVLVIGLDDFKIINDAMGRENGDAVLKEAANRLASLKNEKTDIARLGSDEFLMLLRSTLQRYEVEAEIQKVLQLFRYPIHFNDGEIIVTVSIGAVLFPKDAQTTDMIIRNGDIALQQCKSHGKNGYVFFDDKMAKESLRRIRLDAGLKTAFGNQEFSLHYQPIFRADTLKLAGFEALVRWNSPEFGFVSPAEFIKLAEQNGRIVQLGSWVLREACEFLNRLNQLGDTDSYLSINLSPVQLLQKDFVSQVKEVLRDTGAFKDRIVLEITETALMESFETSHQKLMVLSDWGISFALDDFGTGYSSLNYLRSIPVQTLKIDKSFVDDLLHDERLQRMVKAIIDISHDLGLTVITEGVEEEAQLMLLNSYGCDCIQGYLLGRPVPEEKAIEYLQNRQS